MERGWVLGRASCLLVVAACADRAGDGRGAFDPAPAPLPSAASAALPAPPAPTLLPPRPPYREPPEVAPLTTGRLRLTGTVPDLAHVFTGEIDGRAVVVHPATRDGPQRYKAQVAYYRLARALGVPAVPPSTVRVELLADLLGSAAAGAE